MRWLKWMLVAGWIGAHALLWTLLPPVPRHTIQVDFTPPSFWQLPACTFTPDGLAFVVNRESAIDVFNVEIGKLERRIPRPPGSSGEPTDLVMAPIGRRALVYDQPHNSPLFIDLEDGRTVLLPPFGGPGGTSYLGGFARLAVFAPDGQGFVRSDWATADKEQFARFFKCATATATAWRLPDYAEHLAFAPDGRWAAAIARRVKVSNNSGEGVCLIDTSAGRVIAIAVTSVGAYGIPAFSPDSRTLATGKMRWPKGANLSGMWLPAAVQIYDVPSLTPLATFHEESLVGWCPNGHLVTASESFLSVGPIIRVRDGRTGSLLAEHCISASAPPWRTEWLPDTFRGPLMVARLEYGPPHWKIWLRQHLPWRIVEARETSVFQVVDVESGNVVAAFPESAENVAVSPDGRTAAVVDGNEIRIWDIPPRTPGGIVLGLMIAEVGMAIAWTMWRRRQPRRG